MKKSNKVMALLLAGTMAASMTACSSQPAETAAPETEAAAEAAETVAAASGENTMGGFVHLNFLVVASKK